MKTIILTLDDIRTIVNRVGPDRLMDEVVERLWIACHEFEQKIFEVPVRDGFEYTLPRMGLLEWMPVMKTGSCATLKVVGYHPHNPSERNLPTILSVAMTFDTDTGHLMGLVDGTFPTAIRTGAASAAASRVLAHKDSRVLGLIGAGAQAVTQLHALSRSFSLTEVLVYDVDPATKADFSARTEHLGLPNLRVRASELQEVVRNADIICTATSVEIGKGPVFEDEGLQGHVHVNAVGSDFPGKTELPKSLLDRALVCPDFLVQAAKEGECQQLAPGSIGPDLVALTKEPDKYADYRNKPTVFDSTGWALEDHVMMDILFAHARALGCGSPVQIESVSGDPKNPYAFLTTRMADTQDTGDLTKPCQLYAID